MTSTALRPRLTLLFAAACTLAACSEPAPSSPPAIKAMPVTVLTMQPHAIPNAIEAVAQTEGAKEAEVRARVSGVLLKQLYQEGEAVKAGQALFQIDRATYDIAHAEAQSIANRTAREAQRMKLLLASEGVSRKEFDDAVSANELAQATLRQAKLNLSWTTVTAPVAGIAGRASKSVGNLMTTRTDSILTTVYQQDPMWVRFSLSESEVAKLPGGLLTPKILTGVALVLADGSTYAAAGKLNFLASTVDPTLGTQQLRAEFPNPEGRLRPGQFVRARLLAGETTGAFLVPQSAVVQTEQGNVVMTVDAKNTVAPRPIKTGDWLGQDWVVLDGLKAGDRVIIDNLMKLRPGAPVLPHAPNEKPRATPAAAPSAKQS